MKMTDKIKKILSNQSPFKILITIFIIGLLYGGVSLLLKYQAYMKFMNTTQKVGVKVSSVVINTAEEKFRALSTIKSSKSVDITSKVNGIIHEIHFTEGKNIKKNQKLYSILSSDKIGMSEIYAPFDGLVGLSKKEVRDTVVKGDYLTSLDDSRKMKLELNLPEKLLPYLSKDISFRAVSDTMPDQIYYGELDFIDTRINKNTRTIAAYALIDNKNYTLRPGLLMKVDLILKTIENAILIPEESLLSINSNHYVYIASEDKALMREIEIGIRSNAMIQVLSGLSKDDKIIYMGQEKLKDKSLISIID